MAKKKQTYNPLKLWGTWLGIVGYFVLNQIVDQGTVSINDLVNTPLLPLIFFLIVIPGTAGYLIHITIRAIWNANKNKR